MEVIINWNFDVASQLATTQRLHWNTTGIPSFRVQFGNAVE